MFHQSLFSSRSRANMSGRKEKRSIIVSSLVLTVIAAIILGVFFYTIYFSRRTHLEEVEVIEITATPVEPVESTELLLIKESLESSWNSAVGIIKEVPTFLISLGSQIFSSMTSDQDVDSNDSNVFSFVVKR